MSRSILDLAGGEASFGRGVGEVVEGVGVDFRNASAQERADEELEAFEFGLDDYEAEVGFGVRVSRLLFYELNLKGKAYVRQCTWSRGKGDVPASVFSPECVPSGHPATAVFLGHFAP